MHIARPARRQVIIVAHHPCRPGVIQTIARDAGGFQQEPGAPGGYVAKSSGRASAPVSFHFHAAVTERLFVGFRCRCGNTAGPRSARSEHTSSQALRSSFQVSAVVRLPCSTERRCAAKWREQPALRRGIPRQSAGTATRRRRRRKSPQRTPAAAGFQIGFHARRVAARQQHCIEIVNPQLLVTQGTAKSASRNMAAYARRAGLCARNSRPIRRSLRSSRMKPQASSPRRSASADRPAPAARPGWQTTPVAGVVEDLPADRHLGRIEIATGNRDDDFHRNALIQLKYCIAPANRRCTPPDRRP